MVEYDTSARDLARQSRIWDYFWIGALVIGGMAFAATFVSLMYSTGQGHRSQCRGNLVQLAFGMRVYQDKYGHLPPAYIDEPDGRQMHSWRILLMEGMLMMSPTPYDFSEPWDSANNMRVGDSRPTRYACPSDSAGQKDQRLTNYFVVTGRNTPFPGNGTTSLPAFAGPKGTSNTILMVEANNLNIEWLEPRDLTYDGMSFVPDDAKRPSISSHHPDGPFVVMADGSTRSIKGIAPEVLRAMLQYHPEAEDD